MAEIYYERYWLAAKGELLRRKLDFATFDTTVNMGPNRAIRILQEATGCEADGMFGREDKSGLRQLRPWRGADQVLRGREGLYRNFPSQPG